MSEPDVVRPMANRALTAAGAALAAAGVALSAYAAHGADGEAMARLQMAALFGFGHGVALAALAPQATRPLSRLALAAMLLGVLTFSGSMVMAHFLATPTLLIPYGGSLMILAWLLFATTALRR